MTTITETRISTFPSAWDAIGDDGPPFHFDPMHTPFPISPLTASTSFAFEQGYTAAVRELGVPIELHQVRHVNHYNYSRFLMRPPASEQEAAEQGAATEAAIQREIARMLDRWYIEHRPRIVDHHERLQAMRPRGATSAEVLAMLDAVDDIHRDLWTIHFRIAVPMLISMQVFSEYHADLFGEDAAAAHTLMAGSLSESIKAAFGLADLATRARELSLDGLIEATADDELVPALEMSEHGQAFLAGLQAYLETYGLRQDLFDLSTPTWRENSTIALAAVRNFLRSGHDPRAEHEAVARTAQQAFESARQRLADYPGAVWEQFELMVQHARQGAFLQEEHNFYIDQKGLSLMRLFYLEVGRRLADADLLAESDDIFMLRIEEVRELLVEGAFAGGGLPPAIVAERRDELERAAGMTPPPTIGDMASTPPPPDTIVTRAMTAFFGGPPQEAETPGQLKGNPGSRGVASGVARVVRTLDEAKHVQPGEILVALTTMPAWTPLFGVAAAIVTETGGALSHCAIVAREYGIPAVVGAFGATRTIASGQRITVDGTSGLVTIDG